VVRRWCNRLAIAGMALAGAYLGMLITARFVPLPEAFVSRPSTVVEFEDGSPAHVFLSPDEKWRIAIGLDEIDPAYLDALIRLEDKRFFDHHGVDVLAIARAVLFNLRRGHVVSGGSTLTMQLVRVREPRPRTIFSKLVEAFRAMQLEARWSKPQILGAYLEYVPYGKNVEGVEAASIAYFGHRATALSAAEIATLLAVPQNPTHRHPSRRNREALARARDEIAERLLAQHALRRSNGVSAETVLAEVRRTIPPDQLQAFPRLAPHAAAWFRAKHPDLTRIRTTLDRGVQLLAEHTFEAAKAEAAERGIHNGAAVIVDHRTGEVSALVGNFDFFDEAHGGQIIGFDNPRSPGSALKPFLYAMGIDRGLLLPDFLVLDTPRIYGSYAPKNYDGKFSGLVRFEDALSRSLNVPFVNLLRRMGTDNFIGTLKVMGAASVRDRPGYYGLSSAIGGIELTPLEIASLYAALAENGEYRRIRVLASERVPGPEHSTPVFSKGASYLTRRALALKDRPDFPSRRRFSGAPPNIHWKTGTSFGHRDAWSAGSGPRFTAVVWLGNFDNTPSAHLVGADAAGPILFDLLDGLTSKKDSLATTFAPPELETVEVCAYSGRLPGPACPHKKKVLALASNVPTERCSYHVAIDVDSKTGLALTPVCRASHDYRTETFLVLPSSLRRWLDDEHRRLPEPPSWAPGCDPAPSEHAPSIVSPPANHVALLIPGVTRDRQEIPLAAETGSGGRELSWFVDGEFLGTIKAEERLWWIPVPGVHEIVVTDDTGKSSRRRFEVRTSL
jgi:penicillin-binding protein 1C